MINYTTRCCKMQVQDDPGVRPNCIFCNKFEQPIKSDLYITKTRWGTFVGYPNDVIMWTLMGNNAWDGWLFPYYLKHADKTKIAIDIGTYNGFHSVYLASLFHSVVAVEPISHELVTANVAINGLSKDITILKKAASDKHEYLTPTAIDPGNPGGTGVIPLKGGEIHGIPLDEFIEENVGIIKVDAQGMDLHALRGLKDTIRICHPAIVFEHEQGMADYTLESVDAFMREMKYGWKEIPECANNYYAIYRG